jgi:WD40 repeat protein
LDATDNITAFNLSQLGNHLALAFGRSTSELRVVELGEFRDSKKSLIGLPRIYSLDFSPSGERLVLGCRDGSIRVCHRDVDEYSTSIEVIHRGAGAPVNHVEWSKKHNIIVAVSSDRTLKVFKADDFRLLSCTEAHSSWIWSSTVHKEGNFVVTGSRDRTCRLWNLDRLHDIKNGVFTLEPTGQILRFGDPVRSVRFSNHGDLLAVGTQAGKVSLFHFDPRSEKFSLQSTINHERCSKKAKTDKLLKYLNYYRDHKNNHRRGNKKFSELKASDLNSNIFVISLDFSEDDLVLAYGTNIDGYFLHAIDLNERVGGMEDFKIDDKYYRYRVSELKYCHRKHSLFAVCGSKVHGLFYSS